MESSLSVGAACLLVCATSVIGCKGLPKIGEEAESGPKIVLYGYDDDAPRNPPESCKELDRVEVSIVGKGRFPEKELRKEAEAQGGTGVAHIRQAGNEEVFHGTKYMFKGVVVKCPSPKPAGPAAASASAAPSAAP
jgi:hypothetical protein